jgi:phosphate starvation-inducible protein PhoH and related proteins
LHGAQPLTATPSSNKTHQRNLCLHPQDHRRLATLSGNLDEHIRLLEKHLKLHIHNRGCSFQLIGSEYATLHASETLQKLYQRCETQTTLSKEDILLTAKESQPEYQQTSEATEDFKKTVIRAGDVSVQARTPTQASYLKALAHYDINFGIGPAGTGKTFLAVAAAAHALMDNQVNRIILVRPAVEAGEKLGFLPGTLVDKVDPYLRPLYDALYQMLGDEQVTKLIDKNTIEIASLAYMRGRTLNNAFAILDEAQNTTPEQMKMFLTRIGYGTRVVVTGDITQSDLPRHQTSGLRHAITRLQSIDAINFSFFQSSDVVRHPLVQKIIEAYEHNHESNKTT